VSELPGAAVGMLSLVVVGSRETRRLDAETPYLYTRRGCF
jgi:precorrin-3B methylase